MEQFKEDMAAQRPASDTNLNLLKMIESRIIEIMQVENEIKKKHPKSFQQRLPRFMRRRAASHNPKRIPKKLRPIKFSSKERSKLYKYRLRIRIQKHKRILAKYKGRQYKDLNKSILHKWFAKRFKIERKKEGLEQIPLHNNTKNQRNLYRQTLAGCAYLSFAHLISIKINLPYETATLDLLNKLTLSIAGFTFSARSLESGKYEVAVHLFELTEGKSKDREHICPALVSNRDTHLLLWVPREKLLNVKTQLDLIEVPYDIIMPHKCVRIRLLGPDSHTEAAKISEDAEKLKEAVEDVDRRLGRTRDFGVSIGRLVQEKDIDLVYYQTKPRSVDLVLRDRPGRLLWHKLVKNKAHLVGGWRDVNVLMAGSYFRLMPDHMPQLEHKSSTQQ